MYAFYEALHAAAQTGNGLGGSLLLYQVLDEAGRIAALAGNIAGVATLGIDSDTAALKQAVNDGVCDFLVNSLDEALRILKNEVRKKQPVSVCLQQDIASAITEIVERGVQPDFLANSASSNGVLRGRGARTVVPQEGQGVSWTATAAPALWLPKIDAIAASILDPDDEPRQRWLRFASRYLGRLTAGTHCVRMTNAEAAEFRILIEEKVADGSIGCTVRMATDDADNSIDSMIKISAKK